MNFTGFQKDHFLPGWKEPILKRNSCNLQIMPQNVGKFFSQKNVRLSQKLFWEFFRIILIIWKKFGKFWRKKIFLWHFAQKVAQNFWNFGQKPVFFNFSELVDIGRYHKSAEFFFQRSVQILKISTVKILRFR